jgi:hypothetical protein
MIRITKDVLIKVQAERGKLDTDSGKVFEQFIGAFDMSDRLFHGELHFSDVGEEPPKEKVSLQAIISPATAAKPTKSAKPVRSVKPEPVTDKKEK